MRKLHAENVVNSYYMDQDMIVEENQIPGGNEVVQVVDQFDNPWAKLSVILIIGFGVLFYFYLRRESKRDEQRAKERKEQSDRAAEIQDKFTDYLEDENKDIRGKL